MCGIAGTAGFGEPRLAELMAAELAHRGPDDSGAAFFPVERVGLGFRRLAIIDLSSDANQPMGTDDGAISVVFNGEIYNYRELRRRLEEKGHRFRTHSDTEVIIRQYEQSGSGFLQHLNGMFALALIDRREKTMYLARDRLGVKPLFYWHEGARLAFASEIKALLRVPGFQRDVNWQGIYDYLTLLYVPSPQTAFKGVLEVAPGEVLQFDLGSGRLRADRYWDLRERPMDPVDGSEEALRDVLSDAVRLQMVSDVPLGVFLSGGIDSTILTGLAAEASPKPLKTFTVVFSGKHVHFYDERDRARRVAAYFGTDHDEIEVAIDDPTDMLELAGHMDQPFGNPTYYLMYLMSKAARSEVTVALAGVGGDELFAGYPRYRAMVLSRRLRSMPRWSINMALKALRLIPDDYGTMRMRRAREFFEGFDRDEIRQFVNFTYFSDGRRKNALLGPAFPQDRLQPSERIIRDAIEGSRSLGDNRFLDADTRTFLVDNVLRYTDHMSMAASLEARVPYLDHSLVETSLRIPFQRKLRGSTSKLILKEAFADLIPQAVRRTPKRGFNVPLSNWMRDHLDAYFDSPPSHGRNLVEGLIDREELERLRHEHRIGKRDNASELFSVIALDLWFRRSILEEEFEPTPVTSRFP